jgi:hypothetical protein
MTELMIEAMWGDELMPVEVEVALDDDGNVTVAYENCCLSPDRLPPQ